MQRVRVTTLCDGKNDMDFAIEQLHEISEYTGLVISTRRSGRTATLTVSVPYADRFIEQLNASRYGRMYTIKES